MIMEAERIKEWVGGLRALPDTRPVSEANGR